MAFDHAMTTTSCFCYRFVSERHTTVTLCSMFEKEYSPQSKSISRHALRSCIRMSIAKSQASTSTMSFAATPSISNRFTPLSIGDKLVVITLAQNVRHGWVQKSAKLALQICRRLTLRVYIVIVANMLYNMFLLMVYRTVHLFC